MSYLTWVTAANCDAQRTQASAAAQGKWWLWSLYATLTGQVNGLSAGLWTVDSSSNSSAASNIGSGTDHWGGATFAAANFVPNTPTNAHSWMLLKCPTGGVLASSGPWYFCVDYSIGATDYGQASFVLLRGKSGTDTLTNGTTTARPTSTCEIACQDTTDPFENGDTAHNLWQSVTLASTGEFWVHTSTTGSNVTWIGGVTSLVQGAQAAAVDTCPIAAYAGSPTWLLLQNGVTWCETDSQNVFFQTQKHDGSGQVPLAAVPAGYMSGDSYKTNFGLLFSDLTGTDSMTGDNPGLSIATYVSASTYRTAGKGWIPDVYWGSTSTTSGTPGAPGTNSPPWTAMIVNNVWFPWVTSSNIQV